MSHKISTLNSKGQGVVEIEGRKHLVWNSITDEEVEFEIIKKKRSIRECVATYVETPSESRVVPRDQESFLSTSPWQIFAPQLENSIKLEMVKDKFAQLEINKTLVSLNSVETLNHMYNYRTKMEFSFFGDEEGISLAFFKRGSHQGKIKVQGSSLAEETINNTAKSIVQWLNTIQGLEARDLKSLILRSNSAGECVAGLYIKDAAKFGEIKTPELPSDCLGFTIFFSDPKSPAALATKELYSKGQNWLEASIGSTILRFGLNSFFQVNFREFENVLGDISNFLNFEDNIVDFYSGVGSISLPLHHKFRSATLVEINAEAIDFANINIARNNINNCKTLLSPSEKALDLIEQNQVVIFDPPREGLHKHVIQKVLEKLPRKIIYLSCNIDSQIENLKQLKSAYNFVYTGAYNFFPRTPHIESLVVMEAK